MGFQNFLREQLQSSDEKIPIVLFLLDSGKLQIGHGWTKEGVGIFDDEGNQYPGGWDKNQNSYVSVLDTDDTIIGNNGKRIPGWRFYKGKLDLRASRSFDWALSKYFETGDTRYLIKYLNWSL